jgi:CMP-N,N'-diacetyllegionaminic acid synthase
MFNGKSILALITARGGSKGIPGKNIIQLGDKPLLAWTVQAAKSSRYIDRLIISTDDNSIADVAQKWGCEVPFLRPEKLALDTTPSIDVIMHALAALPERYDYLLLLQPTSPFRSATHIDFGIEFLFATRARIVVSVSPVKKDPSLLFYKDDGDVLQQIVAGAAVTRRQDARPAFAHNGAFYFSETDYLKEVKSYRAPGTKGVELPGFIDVDIDDWEDLEFARYIVDKNKHL